MIYLLCNPAVVDDFNRALMRLMRPVHLASPSKPPTHGLFRTQHIHPVTGYAALAMPEEETVPIHLEADGAELDYMLNIFVQDEALTQEEADVIRQQVMDSVGQSVSILDFVPPSRSGYVLTKEQMDAQGWFPPAEEV